MQNVYLISENSGLLERLDQLFDPDEWKVTFIGGSRSNFRKYPNFVGILNSSQNSFVQNLLLQRELLESIEGLVIFGSDSEMRELAESNVELWIKKKLLPTQNPFGFQIFDSKIGFAQITAQLGVQTPPQSVVHSEFEVDDFLSKVSPPVLIKGDRGGGGAFITPINSLNEDERTKINKFQYPFVIQQMIEGEQIAIEVFYWNGELTGYIYNQEIEDMNLYGPSFHRVPSTPMVLDFLDALRLMGTGLSMHGLVNCTFMFDAKTQTHHLVEFDTRPNVWHHLAPLLGLNATKLFSKPITQTVETNVSAFRLISLGRFTQFVFTERNKKAWISFFRAIFDSDSFCIEVASCLPTKKLRYVTRRASRFLVHTALLQGFRALPKGVQAPFKNRKITARVSSRILGN